MIGVTVVPFQTTAPAGGGAGRPDPDVLWGDAAPQPGAALHPRPGAAGAAPAPHLPQAAHLTGHHPAGVLRPLQGGSGPWTLCFPFFLVL